MTMTDKERAYQTHLLSEELHDGVHPDGCFYCGGEHLSQSCPDRQAVDEYWRQEGDCERENQFRDDVEADADVLRMAGMGTDEDYGCYEPTDPSEYF